MTSSINDNILDYADLVARYETGLVDNLRSFGFQTEYLDLWVPDEDLTRSLLNLFNAAAEVGQHNLTIRIPAGALNELKEAGLPALAAKHGQLSIDDGKDGAILRITGLRVVTLTSPGAASAMPSAKSVDSQATIASQQIRPDEAPRQPESLSEPYAGALKAAGKSEFPASDHPDLVRARAEIDGFVLEAAIDPKDHVIQGLTSNGARNAMLGDLLAVLSHICRGLPVLEAADHGAIRLEYLLRGHAPRPRPGIVIPETVEPAFRFVSTLLRALLADYRGKTGYRDKTNTYDTMPDSRWLQADDAARRAQLAEAFSRAGFQLADVIIVAIEFDVRVVISLNETAVKDPAHALAILERHMKHFVDGRLELFLSELKDTNKLRRLSDQKGKVQ